MYEIKNYQYDPGAQASCTKRLMEEMKGLSHKKEKGDTKDYFIFESEFALKSSSEALKYFGSDFIGLVKPNTKGFCKYTIDNRVKYQQGIYYLVFNKKPKVLGDIPVVAIGYKYKSQKVLNSISTEGSGSAKFGTTHLYNLPDHLSNNSI